jgi:hypothetical protein
MERAAMEVRKEPGKACQTASQQTKQNGHAKDEENCHCEFARRSNLRA